MPKFHHRNNNTAVRPDGGFEGLKPLNVPGADAENERLAQILEGEGWVPVCSRATEAALQAIKALAGRYVASQGQQDPGPDLAQVVARLSGVSKHGTGSN